MITVPRAALVRRIAHAVLLLVAALGPAGCGGESPEVLGRRATAEWTAKRYEQAEEALARLARLRPLTLPERLLRVQVARDRGRLDEAVQILGDPPPGASTAETALLLATRGTLELARHRFRDAEAVLNRAIALDPRLAEARRELIRLDALQGRVAELDEHFRALAALQSSPLAFSDLYLWTVGRLEDAGPPELADALRRAVAADPGDDRSRLALAENLRRLGQLDEAGRVLDGATTPTPAAQALRARLLLDRGEPERALDVLGPEPPADGPPTEAASLRLRGRLALIRGDAPAALRALQAALALQPDDREALRACAQALRLVGDEAQARIVSDRLARLDRLEWLVQNARPPVERERSSTLAALGEACLALGRTPLGRAWLRLALARNPLDATLQKRLFQLDQSGS